jgi:uncharacterized protein (TIGR02466 family)
MPTHNHQILLLFPTVVLRDNIDNCSTLNRDLVTEVERIRASSAGVKRANRGGWHSSPDLQTLGNPVFNAVVDHIRARLGVWVEANFELPQTPDATLWDIRLWANVNQRGDFNVGHNHFGTGNVASGVYYVRCGGPEAGGATVFLNDRARELLANSPVVLKSSDYPVIPQDGALLIFPSWLSHEVRPYLGSEKRVTLAFNARHPSLPLKDPKGRPRSERLKNWLRRKYWSLHRKA